MVFNNDGFNNMTRFIGGERVEQIEQVVRIQHRGSVTVSEERNRCGLETRTIQRTRTTYCQADSVVERGTEELGPGEAEMVPGKGESVVLPKAVADELRANVQEDAGVRSADREPHRPDERVLGPLHQR